VIGIGGGFLRCGRAAGVYRGTESRPIGRGRRREANEKVAGSRATTVTWCGRAGGRGFYGRAVWVDRHPPHSIACG
jgi:hypothetical protein